MENELRRSRFAFGRSEIWLMRQVPRGTREGKVTFEWAKQSISPLGPHNRPIVRQEWRKVELEKAQKENERRE